MRRFMAAVLLAPFLVIISSAPAQAAPPGTGWNADAVTLTSSGSGCARADAVKFVRVA